jgi:hypothetical protein
MAIDFPNSPTNGQLFETAGNWWKYNGTYWEATQPQDLHAIGSRETDLTVGIASLITVVPDTFPSDPSGWWSSGDNAFMVPGGTYAWYVEARQSSGSPSLLVYGVSSQWNGMTSGMSLGSGVTKWLSGVVEFTGTTSTQINVQNSDVNFSAVLDYCRLWLKKL